MKHWINHSRLKPPTQESEELINEMDNGIPKQQDYTENLKRELHKENISDKRSSRYLRIIYAVVAVCFAITSIVYWMRFIQFYYDPSRYSDTVFIAITSACTVNILAAFISIVKGLFPVLKD